MGTASSCPPSYAPSYIASCRPSHPLYPSPPPKCCPLLPPSCRFIVPPSFQAEQMVPLGSNCFTIRTKTPRTRTHTPGRDPASHACPPRPSSPNPPPARSGPVGTRIAQDCERNTQQHRTGQGICIPDPFFPGFPLPGGCILRGPYGPPCIFWRRNERSRVTRRSFKRDHPLDLKRTVSLLTIRSTVHSCRLDTAFRCCARRRSRRLAAHGGPVARILIRGVVHHGKSPGRNN